MIRAKLTPLVVQLAPSHKAAIESLAQAQGEPMAVVVRGLIREEALRRGLWPSRRVAVWASCYA